MRSATGGVALVGEAKWPRSPEKEGARRRSDVEALREMECGRSVGSRRDSIGGQ